MDLALGKNLWEAFQRNDFEKLKSLSRTQSNCFQYLEEVCQAHIDRFPKDKSPGRPALVADEIIRSGIVDFPEVFAEFSFREGIYGLSDLQLKTIYNRQIRNP